MAPGADLRMLQPVLVASGPSSDLFRCHLRGVTSAVTATHVLERGMVLQLALKQ